MCNHIRIIARTGDSTRYIARCEHGSLHVVWNNADYLLNRQEPASTLLSSLQDMLAQFGTTDSLRGNARWN